MLDGATALALPTKKGQSLTIAPSEKEGIQWSSYDHKGNCWFQFEVSMQLGVSSKDTEISKTLVAILTKAKQLNPAFLTNHIGFKVDTHLGFPRNWGLGSSSTLINNIAKWAEVDAFTLLRESFGGSGYDIAAAQYNTPIFYAISEEQPEIREVALPWDFTEELFFVHLNKKQDSKEGIANYRKTTISWKDLQYISDLSHKLLLCYTRTDFEALIDAHEKRIAKIIRLPMVQERLFSDYQGGVIKSLGAWGGDFVLVTGKPNQQDYFREKGYTTILPYSEMIL